ncbi:MAG: alpha/beta fold hydrolase [Dehalococcoidia bacterium]
MTEIGSRQSGIAEVNGARLFYEVAGEGPAVVLIHAGIADSRMWDEQFEAFAGHFRVIRYDARGYGRSDMPAGPFAHRDDLHGLLHYLGVERAALVGLSMGGSTTIDFTLDHPELAWALVPVATGLSGYQFSESMLRADEEEEAAFERGDMEAVYEINLRTWVDGPTRPPDAVDPAIREKVRQMQRDASTSTEGEPRRLDPPAIGRLAEITAPTLVIAGDADMPDMPAIADLLASGIAGTQKVMIPGVAHMVNMERPAEFNRLVLDFLRARGQTSR